MKKIFVIIILSIIISAGTAQAATLKGKYPVCMTENMLDHLLEAAETKDKKSWDYLLVSGCTIPKYGTFVTVLDRTGIRKVKVRAYKGPRDMIVWTVNENIQY